jgi:uncharacterized repeat protein (TIGR01451 family)
MTTGTNTRRLSSALALALFLLSAAHSIGHPMDDAVAGGTVIANRAEATYLSGEGEMFNAVSETVTVTVLTVATLNVTPKETESSANVGPHDRIARLFRICNTGNVTTSYTITQAEVSPPSKLVSLYFDVDGSGTITNGDPQIILGQTQSSSVNPNACLGVLVIVDTNDAAPNSLLRIHLVADANASGASGRTEDDGTIINAVGKGPLLTNPANNALPPLKQINGGNQSVVNRGAAFPYSISFRNTGDITARNVVITDDLVTGIDYVPNSLHLEYNGSKDLTDAQDGDEGFARGQYIEVRLPEVEPNQVVRLTFNAQVSSSAPSAIGLTNIANLSADNAAPIRTNTTIVVADPFGTVFAGRAGASAPIANANIALFSDQPLTSLLPLPAGTGLTPNLENANPFVSDGSGHFSFALNPGQIGTESSPGRYFIRTQANGFISRLIELDVIAKDSGLLSLGERALDNQPLAAGGGFTLVRQDVAIDDLTDIAFNIPMFEEHGLEITKSVDQQRVEIGDVVTYRVEVHNPTAATISDVSVHDRLPDSFHYVVGTARLSNGSAAEQQIEPELVNGELVFHIGAITPGASAHLLYRVRIGANVREGTAENLAFAAGVFPSGEPSQSGTASAIVSVGGGVFSTRQMIIGRVFEDKNRNGIFDDGDKPAAGVRLYLTSGQSVITDSQGLYNFPALGDGSQVVSLDPMTLPAGFSLASGNTLAGRSWTRLLRTPVGGGALLRQNFALVCTQGCETREAQANHAEPKSSPTPQPSRAGKESSTGSATTAPKSEGSNAGPHLNKTFMPKLPGTYEVVATETIDPIPAGEIRILSPAANSLVMTPAMELTACVALQWTVKLEVNGEQVSEKNIGTSSRDQKNQVSTFTFVSIGLRPGPNRVHVTAISQEGAAGRSEEFIVMGRGPAERLEIVPERTAIQAGGRDSTVLTVRVFDKWDHPANDGQVGIETTLGKLMRLAEKAPEEDGTVIGQGAVAPQPDLPQKTKQNAGNESQGQLIIPLEKGEAKVKLVGASEIGEAQLHAVLGQLEARSAVRILSEVRPTVLVGLAEMSFGKSIPEVNLRGEQGNSRNRLSFFYSGPLWRGNSLTLAYDSQRPINRTAGRDRLFQLDPLDRVYPLYGDSSTRYEAAPSNSKLYARVDHGRSYAMFGDLDADMTDLALSGYTRKLTGVKLHLEDSKGDFVSLTGARPDTSFARDVFPGGGLSLMLLSHGDILQGSESVAIETRDRRNPEIIISREELIRSIDYNLNTATGELFLLRNISTFDAGLNLIQIVVTYEHRANGLASSVYTARGKKMFAKMGLKLGLSAVMQRQEGGQNFLLGGFDGEKSLPRRGFLRFAWATSQGEVSDGVSSAGFDSGNATHDGNAYSVELQEPINFHDGVVHARFAGASAGYLNPFGSTITPGSRRAEVAFQFKPLASSTLRFSLMNEDNKTENVDNHRFTFSIADDQIINERFRLHFGYDHRSFTDDLNGHNTDSNLVTASLQAQVTDKLDVTIKREQNLGDADPTYPNQTTFAANYRVNNWTKIFLTQRLASGAIIPIGDFSRTGFAQTSALHETAFGVETRFGKYTSFVGRYQLENGANGADSFAVIGLQNRLPLTCGFSLELGVERGFHFAGTGQSFNSATLGFGWTPSSDFRASARYEFRDRGGMGQLFSVGAAGRIGDGITTMARFQIARSDITGQKSSSTDGTAALAIRPLKSDRAGLLFRFNHRSVQQDGLGGQLPTRDRLDTLATDGYYQATKNLELFGRFALHFSASGQPSLPYVSTLTYLTQGRIQYRLSERFDWAAEMRLIYQPSSNTQHNVYATELGFWALPDLRLGVGYNFTGAQEPAGSNPIPTRRGMYFTITSKLSNLFDLFGTSKEGLASTTSTLEQKDNPQKH